MVFHSSSERSRARSEVRVLAPGEGAGGCACDEDRRQAGGLMSVFSAAKEQHDHDKTC